MKRRLLERKRVAARISAQLDGMEQEVHHTIYALKSHNVADEGCEGLRSVLAAHSNNFHLHLGPSRFTFTN